MVHDAGQAVHLLARQGQLLPPSDWASRGSSLPSLWTLWTSETCFPLRVGTPPPSPLEFEVQKVYKIDLLEGLAGNTRKNPTILCAVATAVTTGRLRPVGTGGRA